MRTTLNLNDQLIARAQKSTGVMEKTRLLHLGLEALIQREAARRGGIDTAPKDKSHQEVAGVLPVSTARGGLVNGSASLSEAIAAAELEADRMEVR